MNSADEQKENVSDRVSVVTPCYNAEDFIGDTVASVRDQEYPAVEHIVVDDGSTDGSWDVVQSFGDAVRAVRQENRGQSHARNRGAQLATGEYLMFLDADDVLAPCTLSALVETLANREHAIAAAPWKRLAYDNGQWVERPSDKPPRPPSGDSIEGWLTHWFVPPCGLLWTRAAYKQTDGWDESLCYNEDGDLMLRALIGGIPLVFADDGMAYYRNHDGTERTSVGKTETYDSLGSAAQVMIRAAQRLREQDQLDGYAIHIGRRLHDIARRAFELNRSLTSEEKERVEKWARLARELAGTTAVQGSWAHRWGCYLVGLRRKQYLADTLRHLISQRMIS